MGAENRRISRFPDHVAQFHAACLEHVTSAPADMTALVQSDMVKWGKGIPDAQIPKE